MANLSPLFMAICLSLLVLCFASPVSAFGAGNIGSLSAIEGQNWRHGDIEDTLLTLLMSRAAGGKKFGKLDVKRVYFGNWLRDYSQAVDVGTVKYVSAEAIRLILWVLGFMSFGYGTKEFEVTTERLGCYRPEEHIDNPKDYADNLDARQYDPRLRGPVDERKELAINPQTGLKHYIATENIGIDTSAALIRRLFGRSIELGRRYARSKNEADLYEALRLLGTGCHCLEDYSAHSNYTELALIELGERDVFPHVGRATQMNLPGARRPVYPIVTGTFGGVDFLHSVMGEFSDKATQSELQELSNTCSNSQNNLSNVSLLQDLLNQVPSGLFGGEDQAGKVDELQANATAAQMQNMHVSPRQPEAWARQLQEISKQIAPILEWHDEIIKSITEFIEKIPILPQLIEQIQDEINVFVFSLLAPFVIPIVNQVKTELATGSSEVIKSSREKQLIVFFDDRSTDPTHSMLSKDHFSNILNEPAGKVASQVLKWVVPQLIACWDDERIDINHTLTRIINGVFHHPAQRDSGTDGAADGRRLMFGVVQNWWMQKSEDEKYALRDQLSRDGVEQGRNHKDGVQDTGHGCCKPLGMPSAATATSSGAVGGLAAGAIFGQIGDALQGQSQFDSGASSRPNMGRAASSGLGKFAEEAIGGGALGGIVGGLVGGAGGGLLEGVLGSGSETKSYESQGYGRSGEYSQTYTETGYNQSQQNYAQAAYTRTQYPGGEQRDEYERYNQRRSNGQEGYGEQFIQGTRPMYGGGFEETTETRFERPGGSWESEVVRERVTPRGRYVEEDTVRRGDGGFEEREEEFRRERAREEREREIEREREAEREREREREREQERSHERHGDESERYGDGGEYGNRGYGGGESYREREREGEIYERREYRDEGQYEREREREREAVDEDESYGDDRGYGEDRSYGEENRW
ncbi:hypothetical protein MMC25_003319 [Agyrium rufum]|nr:hypothetical protein [Agyrium rufum]